jgi:hypothetical protein
VLGEFLTLILEAESPDGMLLQQAGEPSYFHKEMTDILSGRHPEKWIVRGGPITWPPHSPDLTPLIVFFPGYMKDTAQVLQLAVPELAMRVTAAGGKAAWT